MSETTAALQQKAVDAIAQQIIAVGRVPGGQVKDSLAIVEQIAATVMIRGVDPADDAATIAAFSIGLTSRVASWRAAFAAPPAPPSLATAKPPA
jgi:hypothetical protein